MMLRHMSLSTSTLKTLKSLDCMYGTRNIRLSRATKRDHFLDLLSTKIQTNNLNTYTKPKPLWQDTHEVSQGLEHDTLVNLTHTWLCQWHIHICVNKTLPYFSTKPCIQFKNQIHEWGRLSMGNMPMKFGYNLRTLKITHTRMGENWSFQNASRSHTNTS